MGYRVVFVNNGDTKIGGLVINDTVPDMTGFVSAACPTPLPGGLTTCTMSAPAAGAVGPISWTFGGQLNPAAGAAVTFQVMVK